LLVSNDGNRGGVSTVIQQLLKMSECTFRVICGSLGAFVDDLQAARQNVQVINLESSLSRPTPFLRLAREIRNFRPHVVHSHHARAYLRGRIVAKLAGVPHISTPHSLFLDELDRRAGLEPWRRKMYMAREKLTAPLDNFTVALTEYQRENLVRLGVPEERVCVIPNGIELERFPRREGEPSSGPQASYTLGVAGRVTKEKGIGDILTAFAQLPPVVDGAVLQLVIMGDGPDRKYFEKLSGTLGVSERVKWLGHRTDIPELWQTIDVAVFPSRYEGLPLALLEAMAAMRPIVAVDLPIFTQVLSGGCGKVVSREKLGDGIRELLSSPVQARHFAQNARVKAEREFDVRRMLNETFTLYCQAAGVENTR
jgi:glycosyltransferase involved in cell wall biosynthesis